MASITSILDEPQVKAILDSDKILIAELETDLAILKEENRRAHLKATNRRIAIKGLERRAEHLEHLLAASRGDSERLNKYEYAVRILLRLCRGDAFAAFDALLEYAFDGRVDELCEHISQLDTELCENECGEWLTESIHYNNDGVPFCNNCWNQQDTQE